ncbi:restriction endonuclease subunit S [Desulfovibrio subterraneus]|uniref:Specificity protein S n=1 Tax=Desulfovibrio subterraneus TaxID=2718620 RepID=A0A7J0BFA1_9BACT|nr:restriction endonuclease subunit S [Desulfovibrio subterraneus]GFM32377.1 specificity protein S [Desulfovibrio subterraneus]
MAQAKHTDWPEVALQDVCDKLTVGHVGSMANEYVEKGIPFLRSQNVMPFSVSLSDVKFISPEFHSKLKKSELRPGDVVVVRTGYPGTAAVVPPHLPVSNCADLVIIRPSNRLDPYFLSAIFNSTWGKGVVAGNLVGVAQQHFNVGAAKSMRIALPPLSTQRRIASILSAYDDLIENNTRRIEILEEMARRIYEEWFVNFRFPGHEDAKFVETEQGRIPEGWKRGKLEDVVVLQRGFDLPKKLRQDGEFLVVSATGASGTHIECKVKAPGVVTGRSGSLGTVSYITQDYWPLNTTLWGKAYPLGSVALAFFVLNSIDLKGFNSGAAVPTLNRNDIHGLPMPIPPSGLVEQFDEYATQLFKLRQNLINKNGNLRVQRDLLLPKLVSGQIDVSDAENMLEDVA